MFSVSIPCIPETDINRLDRHFIYKLPFSEAFGTCVVGYVSKHIPICLCHNGSVFVCGSQMFTEIFYNI